MKKFVNIFYTMQGKTIVTILILVCAWLMNSGLTNIFSLYDEDRTAFKNVLIQADDFDYQSSYFLQDEIEKAITDVLEYSLSYHRNGDIHESATISDDAIMYLAEGFVKNKTVNRIFISESFILLTECEEDLSEVEIDGKFYTQRVNYDKIHSSDTSVDFGEIYKRATDEDYDKIVSHLNALNNFSFAVVNHKTHVIISNIPSLNGQAPGVSVRSFFPEGNLLIVRDAKTPYSESGTMVEYVSFVGEQAKNYTDNFDLYISFGDNMEFAGDSEKFSHRHEATLNEIKDNLFSIVIFLCIIIVLFALLLTVAGRREKGGRVYPSLTDKLPNDINLLFCLVVIISMVALYENSINMFLRASDLEDYWFNLSPKYYLLRSNICIVVLFYDLTAFAGTLKRQIGCGTLISNTYIYKVIKNYKKAEPPV